MFTQETWVSVRLFVCIMCSSGLDQNKKWKFEQQAELLLLLMERRGKNKTKGLLKQERAV